LHGGHQAAQKFNTSGLPAYSLSFLVLPSAVVKLKSGALPQAAALVAPLLLAVLPAGVVVFADCPLLSLLCGFGQELSVSRASNTAAKMICM
jgi:hypothetical protein